MARHVDPVELAKLAAIQRVKVTAAELHLAEAREEEAQAGREEDLAHERLRASQEQWLECLAAPAFAPEFARALARQLVEGDGRWDAARAAHRDAAGRSLCCEEQWSLSDAQLRTTKREWRLATRATTARRDERKVAAFADRVSYQWVMT